MLLGISLWSQQEALEKKDVISSFFQNISSRELRGKAQIRTDSNTEERRGYGRH
jgi:hypothetical protein